MVPASPADQLASTALALFCVTIPATCQTLLQTPQASAFPWCTALFHLKEPTNIPTKPWLKLKQLRQSEQITEKLLFWLENAANLSLWQVWNWSKVNKGFKKTAGVCIQYIFFCFNHPQNLFFFFIIWFSSPPAVGIQKTCLNQNMMSLQISCGWQREMSGMPCRRRLGFDYTLSQSDGTKKHKPLPEPKWHLGEENRPRAVINGKTEEHKDAAQSVKTQKLCWLFCSHPRHF